MKFYNVELNKKDTIKLMDFLNENNIYYKNSYINSNYCHTEILLNDNTVTLVNNFLSTL